MVEDKMRSTSLLWLGNMYTRDARHYLMSSFVNQFFEWESDLGGD